MSTRTAPPSPSPAWLKHGFWPVLLAGFLLRLWSMIRQEIVSVDGTTYIRLARALFGGTPFETVQPPGYPFLIGLASFVIPGDGVRAAQVVCLLTGTLLLWPFHALARRFLPPPDALLATTLLMLTPTAIRMSATTMSEAPYLLALLLALLLLVRRRPLAAGVVGGASSLIRPEGLIVMAGLALIHAWRPLPLERAEGAGGAPPPRGRRAALLVALGVLLGGILPTLAYNHARTGAFTLSGKGINVASVNFWQRELTVGRLDGRTDSLDVGGRVNRYAGAIVRNYPRALGSHAAHLAWSVGPPAVVAALTGIPLAPPLVATLAPIAMLPLFPAITDHPRFVLPLVPFVWILAFLALGWIATRRPGWRTPLLALLLLGFAVSALVEAQRLPRNEDGYFPELRAAGRVLRNVAPPDALIFDRKPYVAFYAERAGQTIPLDTYDATIDAMNRNGATYLVVSDTVTPVFRPDLVPLLDDGFAMLNDPRLGLVYFDERDPQRRVAIYQFVRPELPPITPGQRTRAAELVHAIPHNPARHGLHADLLRRQEDYAGMCRECELLLEAEPDNWRAMLNLALGLGLLNRDAPRALDLLHRARALKPGQPEIERAIAAAGARTP